MRLNRTFSSGSAASSSRGPAASDSAPPRRHAFRGLIGRLASLAIRQSSGPPAPPTSLPASPSPLCPDSTFARFNPNVLGIIVAKLSEGPRTEAGRHLVHASLANKALRTAVADSESATHRLLQAPLEHLSPTQRERLVAGILQGQSYLEFKALTPGLGHVVPEQQHQLLEAVAGLSYSRKIAIVAGDIPLPRLHGEQCSARQAKPALAAALPSLDPELRDKVAAIVLGIWPESGDSAAGDITRAIGALELHLGHLEEGRRQALRVLRRPRTERWAAHTLQATTQGLGRRLEGPGRREAPSPGQRGRRHGFPAAQLRTGPFLRPQTDELRRGHRRAGFGPAAPELAPVRGTDPRGRPSGSSVRAGRQVCD